MAEAERSLVVCRGALLWSPWAWHPRVRFRRPAEVGRNGLTTSKYHDNVDCDRWDSLCTQWLHWTRKSRVHSSASDRELGGARRPCGILKCPHSLSTPCVPPCKAPYSHLLVSCPTTLPRARRAVHRVAFMESSMEHTHNFPIRKLPGGGSSPERGTRSRHPCL